MNRSKKLCILLGVLAVVCAAAFAALGMEERREQIKTSGETVLEIDPDSVQALSWEYEGRTLAFHKDETWLYDDDAEFPVDEEKINGLLEQFQAFGAAFIIEDVEDFGQYGLDDPVCTIAVTTEERTCEILLGNYSNMDAQRYVSTGDGNVYLAASDPLDYFDAGLSDMIDHDETPWLSQASELRFKGAENYDVVYEEDSGETYCADDVYFAELDGKKLPLDASRIEAYLNCISCLSLTDYVTYSVTGAELQAFGLDDPELTVTVTYDGEDGNGEAAVESFVLAVSRDPEERAAAESRTDREAADEDEEIAAYVRVGQSQIVYRISAEDYKSLMAASYDDLRHRELFYADFADVARIGISLDGAEYIVDSEEKGGERAWSYQDGEIDAAGLQSAVEGLYAASFTDERPTQKKEIGLTLYLDSESFPEVRIDLYRYDGSSCLALIDGEPVALVERSAAVDLIEAVHAVVLD